MTLVPNNSVQLHPPGRGGGTTVVGREASLRSAHDRHVFPDASRRMPRPSRRIAGTFAGLLFVGLTQACGPSVVPLDTLASNSSQADNLASSVAGSAGCGSFEALGPASTQASWGFTCQMADASYDIVVFGSDDARRSGLKAFQDAGRPYVGKGYYAVTVALTGATKSEALRASPPASLLDRFR